MTKILRNFARWILWVTWRSSLSRGDAIRLDYWGATGNPAHHPWAFADDEWLTGPRA